MQDNAASHRAKAKRQFLRQNTLDFIVDDGWASYSVAVAFGEHEACMVLFAG